MMKSTKFSFVVSLVALVLVVVICLTGVNKESYGYYIEGALGVFSLLYMLMSITHYRRSQPRETPAFIIAQCFVTIATICLIVIMSM